MSELATLKGHSIVRCGFDHYCGDSVLQRAVATKE